MAFRRSARGGRQIREVNMTPLMDLTFLLLITFMITFPLIEQGIPLKLPQGKAKELDDSAKASVSVDANGKVYVDELEVELDMVGPMLKERLAAQPELTVLVRAENKNYEPAQAETVTLYFSLTRRTASPLFTLRGKRYTFRCPDSADNPCPYSASKYSPSDKPARRRDQG